MIEAILHFLKIHRKMIFGNTTIVVQDMLRKTPKSFNAINMVLGLLVDQCLRVVDRMVLPQTLEGIVAPKRVGVVDRTLPRFLPDDGHKFFFRDMLHHSRIYSSIALHEAKYDAFTSCSTSSLSLASAAEVRLVQFDLSFQLFAFKFCHMVDRFAKALVHSAYRLIVHIKIVREAIRRLLFVESSDNRYFFLQLLQGFLFSTPLVSASHIPSRRSTYIERTAKYALPSSQKVGRTTENVISPCNHKDILASSGYDSN